MTLPGVPLPWAFDGGLGPDGAERLPGELQPSPSARPATTVAQVARGDLELRRYAAANDGLDLYERVKHIRASPASPPLSAGPSQLRLLPGGVLPLPQAVAVRYQQGARACFCGLLPEIHHAWASIDSSLFLWRYDTRGAVPVEYAAEQHHISAVGLVRPKPGVLVASIEHLLVVCTTREVALLGVHWPSRSGNIALNPLPLFSVPTETPACCVASTPSGRIFLGSADGLVHEVKYGASGWRAQRCFLVRIPPGLSKWVPNVVRQVVLGALPFLAGAPREVEQLVVDEAGTTLVARTRTGVAVFHISGTDGATRVGEMPELVKRCREERSLQKDLGSSPSEELIYAAPIPDYETDRLGLLVVTKDGLRVLLSTSKRSGAPTDLHLRAVLPPLPAGPQGAAARPTCAAAYQHAALAVCTVPGNGEAGTCDVAASFQRQQPVTEAPGSFAVQGIPGTTATSAALPPGVVLKPGVVTLSTPRKAPVEQLAFLAHDGLPGQAVVAVGAPRDPELVQALQGAKREAQAALLGELVAQFALPRQRFVVMTDQGIAQIERRWPVDVLEDILALPHPSLEASSPLGQFLEAYGAQETAAMAYFLLSRGTAPAGAQQAARDLLRAPQLTRVVAHASSSGADAAASGPPPRALVFSPAPGAARAAAARQGSLIPGQSPGWDITRRVVSLLPTPLRGRTAGEAVKTPPAGVLQWHPPLVWPVLGYGNGAGTLRAEWDVSTATAAGPSACREGLCLLLSRALLLAWDVPMFAAAKSASAARASVAGGTPRGTGKGTVVVKPPVPLAMLAEARDRLHRLHAVLAQRESPTFWKVQSLLRMDGDGAHLGKRKGSPGMLFGGAEDALGRQTPGLPGSAYKRMRGADGERVGLGRGGEEDAEAVEEEAMASLQALVARAAQVLSLLILASRQRLSPMEAPTVDLLTRSTLRALVVEEAGEQALRAVIHAMQPQEADDALRQALGAECPSFFKEEDQKALLATKALAEADRMAEGPDKQDRAAAALALLLELPGSVDLGAAVPILARVGMIDGCVQLVARAAHLSDPEQLAGRLGPEGEAARARRHQSYRHLLSAVVALGKPAIAKLLRSQAAAQDPWLADFTFEYLAAARQGDVLLAQAPASRLEDFFLRAGGIDADLTRPLPALLPAQEQCLLLLSDLYVRQGRSERAARVLEALARRDGLGIADRRALLGRARSAAESAGVPSGEIANLLEVLDLQEDVLRRAERAGAGRVSQATLTALSTTLMTLSSLYNDVAHPLHLWDLCLRILDASELPEAHAEVALALWTNLLVHPGSEEAAGEQEGAQWVGLQEATETVVGVGRALRLGGPALPLAFIARQLFEVAGAALGEPECVRIAEALRAACEREGGTALASAAPAMAALTDVAHATADTGTQEAALVAAAHLASAVSAEAAGVPQGSAGLRELAALRDACQRLRSGAARAMSAELAEVAAGAANRAIAALDRMGRVGFRG